MNILVISYYYGYAASGIISERVVNSLARNGCSIKVISSSPEKQRYNSESVQYICVPHIISENSFLFRLLKLIIGSLFIRAYNLWWRKNTEKRALKIVKEWDPEWLYCRSTPIDACIIGEYLRNKTGIKVLQHFTDPVPSPLDKNDIIRHRLLDITNNILKGANLISFGNEAMFNYSKSIRDFNFAEKVFISPDPAISSNITMMPQKQRNEIVLLYLGNITGSRNPIPLLSVISKMRKTYPVVLWMSCNKPLLPSNDLSLKYPFVKYLGTTDSVLSVISESNYLVDLDGDDDIPVFISSKLKDYLLSNRPILSITPSNSPSAFLLKDLKTVFVTCNTETCISNALTKMIENVFPDDAFKERCNVIKMFNPDNVACNIISKLNDYEA